MSNVSDAGVMCCVWHLDCWGEKPENCRKEIARLSFNNGANGNPKEIQYNRNCEVTAFQFQVSSCFEVMKWQKMSSSHICDLQQNVHGDETGVHPAVRKIATHCIPRAVKPNLLQP